MIVYVQLDEKNNVANIGTVQDGVLYTKVVLEDPVVDLTKLPGYRIDFMEDAKYMVFDQGKYDTYLEEEAKKQAYNEGKELANQIAENNILKTASDEDAYTMRYLYEPWMKDTKYKTGDRRRFEDNLYKCKQGHTSEAQHTPDLIPALWDLINPNSSAGTLDNPILIPEPFSSMEYEYGKYYKEGSTTYRMNRQGMKEGDTISLTFKPSQLVGQYFEIVK